MARRSTAALAARRATFLVLFVLAGWLGRATIVDQHALSLVWPAAGVALLWLLHRHGRGWLLLDIALIGLTTFWVNRLTGSSTAMAAVFVVANLLQAVVIRALLLRWSPELFAASMNPARTALGSPRRLLRFLVAAALGCLIAVVVGTAGLQVFGGFFSVSSTLTWWGRNLCGVLGVGVTGILVLSRGRSWRRVGVAAPARRPVVELTALVCVTCALFLPDLFVGYLPLSFLLPATTVWAGMRFPSVVVALHALLAGAATVWLTLVGQGPFADAPSVQLSALLAQLFVGMTLVLGLFLAMSREENSRLHAEVMDSQRRTAEQAELLAAIIAAMHDGVVVVNGEGTVALINPAADSALAVGTGREVGAQATAFELFAVDGSRIPDDQRPSAKALLGDRVGPMDVRLTADPEKPRIYSATATPLHSAADQVTGAVLVFHEVTDDRRHQAELADFASVVAHDLLNPIGVVDGWSEALADALEDEQAAGSSPEAMRQMVARIASASGRMRNLVKDLLADATSRNRELSLGAVDVRALVGDIAVERGAASSVHAEPVPLVAGDLVLLRQLMDNLIGNALKYVRPGQTPCVQVSGQADDAESVTIRVGDDGVGIPDGQHDRVFDSFHRAHAAEYPGTGLGLPICRRIVERHGGRIRALPRPGGPGTVIELQLPRWREQAGEPRPGPG